MWGSLSLKSWVKCFIRSICCCLSLVGNKVKASTGFSCLISARFVDQWMQQRQQRSEGLNGWLLLFCCKGNNLQFIAAGYGLTFLSPLLQTKDRNFYLGTTKSISVAPSGCYKTSIRCWYRLHLIDGCTRILFRFLIFFIWNFKENIESCVVRAIAPGQLQLPVL